MRVPLLVCLVRWGILEMERKGLFIERSHLSTRERDGAYAVLGLLVLLLLDSRWFRGCIVDISLQ